MNKVKIFISTYLFLSLAACSSNATQLPVLAPPSLAPPSVTIVEQPTEQPTVPEPESMPDVAQYGLVGRLVLVKYNSSGNRLIELDLASGEVRTLFQAPDASWLAAALVSPDHQQILLTYAPPPPSDETQFGYSDLYLMPYDGTSQPQPFLTRSEPQESYFFSTWGAGSQSVYYTHLYRIDPNSEVPAFQNDVEKATLNGQTETLVEHGLWPAVSPDGSKIAYLYADPATFSNDLYLANPDGSDQAPVMQPGVNPPVDAHLFSKDGSQLIFSMVNPQPEPASSWLDKLFGLQIASAHNVPSDWYWTPLNGGSPQRLTSLYDVNLNGDLSPDGSQMAFIGASGLYVMNTDGSNLELLTNDLFIGTVSWLP